MSVDLVERVCAEVAARYVLVERVPEVLAALRGRSASLASLRGGELAEAVTAELRESSGDLHFKLIHHAAPRALRTKPDEETPEEVAEYRRIARENNHGCRRVERLDGNVGYWQISEFHDLIDGSGPTFVAAMNLLRHTAALIVDVRGNSGGDPETVALACSFLFDVEPVHLNTLESDQGRTKRQFWTLAHLDCARYLDRPVFVLVDARTFSAAEEFAYDLQSLRRATVVGQPTAGAAHLREQYQLDEHFFLNVPIARAVNPITGTNWEGVGVVPDVEVDPDEALARACELARA